jgi:hypothetical protein
MGVWSTGLYSGDFALDLRSAIAAVTRLPLDHEQLIEALRQLEPAAAHHPDDPDHAAFWLILADQFAKRGINAPRARDRALDIIDNGEDLAMLKKLGMDEPSLAKRRQILQTLRERITNPPPTKPRATLKKPQPYLLEIGDVIAYPTDKGKCINPFLPPGHSLSTGFLAWNQDGWNLFVVIDRGRAFDFLTWYRPLVLTSPASQVSALRYQDSDAIWKFELGGTCSTSHFQRMRLQKIAHLSIDPAKLKIIFPDMRPSNSQAISNISIANRLSVTRHASLAPPNTSPKERKGRTNTIVGIHQILSDN